MNMPESVNFGISYLHRSMHACRVVCVCVSKDDKTNYFDSDWINKVLTVTGP